MRSKRHGTESFGHKSAKQALVKLDQEDRRNFPAKLARQVRECPEIIHLTLLQDKTSER